MTTETNAEWSAIDFLRRNVIREKGYTKMFVDAIEEVTLLAERAQELEVKLNGDGLLNLEEQLSHALKEIEGLQQELQIVRETSVSVENIDCYTKSIKEENARLREQLSELQKSNPVAVIKRRNGKATIIRWNDERYVFQSESAARGGVSYAKGQARKT